MSILVNKNTRLLVQGITGNEGLFHSKQMLDYPTPIGKPKDGYTRMIHMVGLNGT